MKKRIAWLILLLVLVVVSTVAAEPQIPPKPTNSLYVQDYAGILSNDAKTRINRLGAQLDAKTKAQVVVVTVNSVEGAALEEYSLAILRQWGIGDKTLNNGVLLLVAAGDRQSRIEVGYGLEGRLPDAKTGRVQDEYMIPYFQKGDYEKGIVNGYMALVGEVAKEYNLELKGQPKPVQSRSGVSTSAWDQLPWWMQLALAVGLLGLVIIDWLFLGGSITRLLLMLLAHGRGGGGGSGGGGYGGGSGGGGGSSRRW
ncbi:TPM domain-containing protein [Acetonema longum]|uniref:TPM domain-containing protein n=1 Tax=Acetonema longum DSM 6540 TaxID=1009370 RepID=F7NGF9_9FIRM|nr:TPM domain-containing protein [Acetonema longum]EGO64874.1 hypothetical protein ALO_05735 [Acetonema longum DSM 6540]